MEAEEIEERHEDNTVTSTVHDDVDKNVEFIRHLDCFTPGMIETGLKTTPWHQFIDNFIIVSGSSNVDICVNSVPMVILQRPMNTSLPSNIAKFCQPSSLIMQRQHNHHHQQQPTLSGFVMTLEDGSLRYGTCLSFNNDEDASIITLCLLSSHPYWIVHQTVLAALWNQTVKSSMMMVIELNAIVNCFIECSWPVIPPLKGTLCVNLAGRDGESLCKVHIPGPIGGGMLAANLDLLSVIKLFGVSRFMTVLLAVLSDRKVALLSRSFTRLIMATRGVEVLAYPFNIRCVYIPVWPTDRDSYSRTEDVLAAPCPFFIGLLSDGAPYSHRLEALLLSHGVLICDLDDDGLRGAVLDISCMPKDPMTTACRQLQCLLRGDATHADAFPNTGNSVNFVPIVKNVDIQAIMLHLWAWIFMGFHEYTYICRIAPIMTGYFDSAAFVAARWPNCSLLVDIFSSQSFSGFVDSHLDPCRHDPLNEVIDLLTQRFNRNNINTEHLGYDKFFEDIVAILESNVEVTLDTHIEIACKDYGDYEDTVAKYDSVFRRIMFALRDNSIGDSVLAPFVISKFTGDKDEYGKNALSIQLDTDISDNIELRLDPSSARVMSSIILQIFSGTGVVLSVAVANICRNLFISSQEARLTFVRRILIELGTGTFPRRDICQLMRDDFETLCDLLALLANVCMDTSDRNTMVLLVPGMFGIAGPSEDFIVVSTTTLNAPPAISVRSNCQNDVLVYQELRKLSLWQDDDFWTALFCHSLHMQRELALFGGRSFADTWKGKDSIKGLVELSKEGKQRLAASETEVIFGTLKLCTVWMSALGRNKRDLRRFIYHACNLTGLHEIAVDNILPCVAEETVSYGNLLPRFLPSLPNDIVCRLDINNASPCCDGILRGTVVKDTLIEERGTSEDRFTAVFVEGTLVALSATAWECGEHAHWDARFAVKLHGARMLQIAIFARKLVHDIFLSGTAIPLRSLMRGECRFKLRSSVNNMLKHTVTLNIEDINFI